MKRGERDRVSRYTKYDDCGLVIAEGGIEKVWNQKISNSERKNLLYE
jgi:hypothetical protein